MFPCTPPKIKKRQRRVSGSMQWVKAASSWGCMYPQAASSHVRILLCTSTSSGRRSGVTREARPPRNVRQVCDGERLRCCPSSVEEAVPVASLTMPTSLHEHVFEEQQARPESPRPWKRSWPPRTRPSRANNAEAGVPSCWTLEHLSRCALCPGEPDAVRLARTPKPLPSQGLAPDVDPSLRDNRRLADIWIRWGLLEAWDAFVSSTMRPAAFAPAAPDAASVFAALTLIVPPASRTPGQCSARSSSKTHKADGARRDEAPFAGRLTPASPMSSASAAPLTERTRGLF